MNTPLQSGRPMVRWPDGTPRLGYGGDYNPEQWSPEVWKEDAVLMAEAGVTFVNVGVFAWASLEPESGRFEFDQFDEVLDLLHASGVAVDLATGTASPPAWLVRAHPEVLPVGPRGEVLEFGGRQSWCPSSSAYREHSLRLTEAVAEHFGDHPALALWHVSNELGCHNSRCYCATSAASFRAWLTARYGDIDALNHAWGTAFWSQRYGGFDQIEPPRIAPTFPNPTQQLDFARFSSDELKAQLVAERDVLRAVTPDVPITTNFMVMAGIRDMDYADWGPEIDVVSNDHYLQEGVAEPQIELAFSADLTRGVAGGAPWILMEHSTSAVNWGRINRPKRPGEMRRNSLAHVARGADVVSFFQWRQSQAGAEKFHSAMVPHAGAGTRVFREVAALGSDLEMLSPVVGTRVASQVALLFDWEARWASELDSHPSQEFDYHAQALRWYEQLWRRGVSVDVVPPTTALDDYRLLVVPALYLTSDRTAAAVADFAERGGTVVVTYFSGIVDESDHVRLGGYPGAFRDLLGVSAEEFGPLRPGELVALSDGSTGSAWSEDLHLQGAEAVLTFTDGAYADQPAVTRRVLTGGGQAWYVATDLGEDAFRLVVDGLLEASSTSPVAPAEPGLELVRRVGEQGSFVFAINHSDAPLGLSVTGEDLLTGGAVGPGATVPAGGVVVVQEA